MTDTNGVQVVERADTGERRSIGYLFGADRDARVVRAGEGGLKTVGSTDVHRLRISDPDDFYFLHVTRHFFTQPLRYDLSCVPVVLNLVTDADQNPGVLAAAEKLLDGYPGVVLNHPRNVLRTTRENVAYWLRDAEHVHAPRVMKLIPGDAAFMRAALERSGFRWPGILRLAGSHTGRIIGVVETPKAAVDQVVQSAPHIITEFVDTREVSGIYRKMRVFFFGDRAVVRHFIASDHWNIHADDGERFTRNQAKLLADEKLIVNGGYVALPARTRAGLQEIRNAMPLDFFGVDCAIAADGRLVLFEANATMNFLPIGENPAYDHLHVAYQRGREAFQHMLDRAMAQVQRA